MFLEKIDFDDVFEKTNKCIKEIGDVVEKHTGSRDLNTKDTQHTASTTKNIQQYIVDIFLCQLKKYKEISYGISGAGYDIIVDEKKYEIKCSQNKDAQTWTGNKSSNKTNRTILFHFQMENGVISDYAVFYLNLDNCGDKTKWVITKSKNSSFSNLKISVDDIDNIKVLVGNIVPLKIWCKIKYKRILNGIK